MRLVLILGLGLLAGCTNNVPLAQVEDDDPVVQMNPTKWSATVNDLTTPPGDGTSPVLPTPEVMPRT
jgi:uncharacterized lipoprotein YajG